MVRNLVAGSWIASLLLVSSAALAAGKVTVVHGVPGLTVDVYVNGALTLEGFEPEDVAGPLELEAGTYDVAIAPTGAGIDEAVITGSAALADDQFVSLVAHLLEDGTPALSAFELDVSPSEEGSRLTVVHAAAAPTVDVGLKQIWKNVGKVEGLSNGGSAALDLRGGLYFAKIYPAGSNDKVFGPAFLYLRNQYSHVVYAFGSLAGGSFGLITQKIPIPPPMPETGMVSVVHGIPGLTVDVFVNGALTLDDFEPGTVTDPLELPAGDYALAITASEGGDPNDPILAADVTLEAGQNATIVAHLQEDGTPTISPFLNDLSPLKYYDGRVVVRHLAAAPAVDVKLKRSFRKSIKIEDLSNGEEAQADVSRGTYSATLYPAGSPDAVFGPVKLDVPSGTSTIVYATGSLTDGTFGLLVQKLPVGRSSKSWLPGFLFWWLR